MKKWMLYTLIAVFTASSASAAWWSFGSNEKTDEQPAIERPVRGGPDAQRKRPRMSEEKRAKLQKIRAEREAVHKLAETARNETDPAKKAALVDELRAKLTEGSERMHAGFRKRLEKAEQGVEKMRERLAEAEKNKGQRIEQQVENLLAGKKPERPEGKKPGGKRPKGASRKKAPALPAE